MLLSHKHRFIFIHIYKNAGSSITQALLPYAADALHGMLRRLKKKPMPSDTRLPPPYPPHITAKALADRIGLDRFRSYFSFAIVRNPWAWQASLYTYTLKDRRHPHHELVTRLGSFEAYLTWRCASEPDLQRDFVCADDGEQLVDFVGRFERLEDDFRTICARIGIPAKLPFLNPSRSTPYQEFYDERTIELVAQTFKPDIDLFHYEFE